MKRTRSKTKNLEKILLARSSSSTVDALDRDLQWLQFNHRVLHEALDPRTPLLERVRFLHIFTNNLDEFFMKRMGWLQRQASLGMRVKRTQTVDPREYIKIIRDTIAPMLKLQVESFRKEIKPALQKSGIFLLQWNELSEQQKAHASEHFKKSIFPVLTPLAVDPGHPFPFISNLSLSLGVALKYPDADEKLFARIKVPKVFTRWMPIQANNPNEYAFIDIVEIIRENLKLLFTDMEILQVMPFRITRNADIEIDEDEAEDLMELISEELKQRRFGEVVRLEHGPNPDPWMKSLLMEELEITEDQVFEFQEDNFSDLSPIADLNLRQFKYEPWTPITPVSLIDERSDIFQVIRNGDLLIHHPYEAFTSTVERFIRTAADDPKVLAIKMTLYRTGTDSPFIPALIRAAEKGKEVVCLIELKARFDEERNIHLAQTLEDAGVHVVYGIVGLKTHVKTALVIRQDADGLRSFAHIGTGNYNAETAKVYEDFGLFTCEKSITGDLVELFHYLTGRSLKKKYDKLLVAPINMKERFIELIKNEMENVKAGKPAEIIAKCNSIEDHEIITALYQASQAGVKIKLIVRGACCLRPGKASQSENIQVISVVGRFLEHSRIYYFRDAASNPTEGKFFLSSADWMFRNLHFRVESATPIEEAHAKQTLWETLQIMQDDKRQAWDMNIDGTYTQRQPNQSHELGTQDKLMKITKEKTALNYSKMIIK